MIGVHKFALFSLNAGGEIIIMSHHKNITGIGSRELASSMNNKRKSFVEAVIKYVDAWLADPMLEIKESGLFVRNQAGNFQWMPDGALPEQGPVYIGFRLGAGSPTIFAPPVLSTALDAVGDVARNDVAAHLEKGPVSRTSIVNYNRALKTLAESGESITSQFEFVREGDNVFINIAPLLEQPEKMLEMIDMLSRRNWLHVAGKGTGIALAMDGLRRLFRKEGAGEKAVGSAELAGGGYIGAKSSPDELAQVGYWVSRHGMLRNADQSEDRRRRFIEAVCRQASIPLEMQENRETSMGI